MTKEQEKKYDVDEEYVIKKSKDLLGENHNPFKVDSDSFIKKAQELLESETMERENIKYKKNLQITSRGPLVQKALLQMYLDSLKNNKL